MDDFKSMSLKDLTKYILRNRSDQAAWDEFVSRPRPNATIIPFDTPPEEYQKTIKQLFSRENENSSEQVSVSEGDRKKELSNEEILEKLKDLQDGQKEIIKALDSISEGLNKMGNSIDNSIKSLEKSSQYTTKIIEKQKVLSEDIKSMTGWKAYIAPLVIAVIIPLLVGLLDYLVRSSL